MCLRDEGQNSFNSALLSPCLISLVQHNFNCLDLILLWKAAHSRDRYKRARPSRFLVKGTMRVEFEAALLQLGRGPIAIGWVTVAPRLRAQSHSGNRCNRPSPRDPGMMLAAARSQ